MIGWLLDTNVVSELPKVRPEPRVARFVAAQRLNLLYVSAVTLAEIRYGIEVLPDPARRAALNSWLTHTIRPMFEDRILPISEDVMVKWRMLVEEGRKSGHKYAQSDLIIAATGLHHGLTVVTRNPDDYAATRVELFNPWLDLG